MIRAGWLGPFWLGRTRSARWGRALLFAVGLPLVCATLGQWRFVQILELKTQDLRFRLRKPPPIHDDLLVIEIDNETIQAYGGQFPLERDQHGLLLYGLHKAGAASVGFDLFFTTPGANPNQDEFLWFALGQAGPRAALAAHFHDGLTRDALLAAPSDSALMAYTLPLRPGTSMRRVFAGNQLDLPISQFLRPGVGVGHVSLVESLEADGSVRRVPMVIQVGDRLFPTLALVCWMQAHGYSLSDLMADPDRGWIVRAVDQERLLPLARDGLHEVDYVGDRTAFPAPDHRLSYVDALNRIKRAEADSTARGELDVFRGKVVLVGLTGSISFSLDTGVLPVSASSPLLYVHASLLNDLLRGSRLYRTPLWVGLACTGLILLVGGAIGPTLKATRSFWLWLLTVLLLVAAVQAAFALWRVLIPVALPTLALALGYSLITFLTYLGQEGERQILRATFQKYVSRDLLEGILADAGRIQLGGSLKQATVVFVDIRGFTAWTRSVEPRRLVDELNSFLSEMIEVIFEHDGTVNKFLGDAILAVFGAPIERPDDARRGVAAARAMQERLAALNARRQVDAKPPIKMGIGVATGAVVAGNVGSAARMEYTVIGNTVNLAARLQALSLDGHILMDRRTARAAEGVPMRSLGPKLLKGIDEPVEVFEIDASGEGLAPPLVKSDGTASGAVSPIRPA